MTKPLSAIVIDDSNDKKLITLIKTELGIPRVKKFDNTIEALEIISTYKNIDIIFIDYETTLSKTFAFVQNAIATENCEHSKFFLLAAHSSKEFLLEASNNGISAFILKPYKSKKFLEKAKKLLPAVEKRGNKRLSLLESIEATLRFKGKEIKGGIEDISTGGCLIRTKRFGRMGVEIYDIVTIRVNFENEKLGVNAEVIRMEKDETQDHKAITTAFKFTKPSEDNALQLAKFWAYILKERETL